MSPDAAATAILSAPPPLFDWSGGGDEAAPKKNLVTVLNRAGWPSRLVTVAMDSFTSSGQRSGRLVDQEIKVFPRSWLVRMAELCDREPDFFIRMEIDLE